jgi:hypothetical protein
MTNEDVEKDVELKDIPRVDFKRDGTASVSKGELESFNKIIGANEKIDEKIVEESADLYSPTHTSGIYKGTKYHQVLKEAGLWKINPRDIPKDKIEIYVKNMYKLKMPKGRRKIPRGLSKAEQKIAKRKAKVSFQLKNDIFWDEMFFRSLFENFSENLMKNTKGRRANAKFYGVVPMRDTKVKTTVKKRRKVVTFNGLLDEIARDLDWDIRIVEAYYQRHQGSSFRPQLELTREEGAVKLSENIAGIYFQNVRRKTFGLIKADQYFFIRNKDGSFSLISKQEADLSKLKSTQRGRMTPVAKGERVPDVISPSEVPKTWTAEQVAEYFEEFETSYPLILERHRLKKSVSIKRWSLADAEWLRRFHQAFKAQLDQNRRNDKIPEKSIERHSVIKSDVFERLTSARHKDRGYYLGWNKFLIPYFFDRHLGLTFTLAMHFSEEDYYDDKFNEDYIMEDFEYKFPDLDAELYDKETGKTSFSKEYLKFKKEYIREKLVEEYESEFYPTKAVSKTKPKKSSKRKKVDKYKGFALTSKYLTWERKRIKEITEPAVRRYTGMKFLFLMDSDITDQIYDGKPDKNDFYVSDDFSYFSPL